MQKFIRIRLTGLNRFLAIHTMFHASSWLNIALLHNAERRPFSVASMVIVLKLRLGYILIVFEPARASLGPTQTAHRVSDAVDNAQIVDECRPLIRLRLPEALKKARPRTMERRR